MNSDVRKIILISLYFSVFPQFPFGVCIKFVCFFCINIACVVICDSFVVIGSSFHS